MNQYKNFLLILSGLLLSILYLWNRLFRLRLPKDLPLNLSLLNFFIFSIIILFHILLIIKIIRKKQKFQMPLDFIYQPFKSLYKFLIFQDLNLYDKLLNTFYNIGKNFNSKKIYCSIIIIKIFIAFLLFIEILIIGKIKYFYTSLFLLIIPLMYQIYIYILKEFFERKCEQIDNQIAIQWNNPPEFDDNLDHKLITSYFYIKEGCRFDVDYSLYFEYINKVKKDNPKKNINFTKLEKQKIDYINTTLRNLYLLILKYSYETTTKLSRYTQIIISSLYIISWLYVIYISINSLDINEILNLLSSLSIKECDDNNHILF